MAMAYLLLILLMQIATTISFAHLSLTSYDPNPPLQIRIQTLLECSAPPDRPVKSPPIAGINVIYQCGSDRATVADTLTDADGVIIFVVKNAQTTLLDPTTQCRVVIRLPIARCAAFPPEGTLEAVSERLIGTEIDELIGGRVDTYQASEFQYRPPPRY